MEINISASRHRIFLGALYDDKIKLNICFLFRYISVCHHVYAYKKGERKIENFLFKVTSRNEKVIPSTHIKQTCLYLPAATMVSTLYYATKLNSYSRCMGKQEQFLYKLPNFFEERSYPINWIDLPFLSPYRIFIYLQTISFVFIVPMLYASIYRFRKNHDMTFNGKNLFVCKF